jgi:hypothetical protein
MKRKENLNPINISEITDNSNNENRNYNIKKTQSPLIYENE